MTEPVGLETCSGCRPLPDERVGGCPRVVPDQLKAVPVSLELLDEFPKGTHLVGYTHRYKTFRKYPRKWQNPLRLTETVVDQIKN